MSQGIHNQIYSLLIFTITGILIGIIFDIFRVIRKTFKTPDFITYIEDLIFWMITGVLLLFTIFKFNNGEIRSYIFVGLGVGIIIYLLAISKLFIKVNVIIISFFKKIISFIFKYIVKLFKITICKPIHFFVINIRRPISKIKILTKKGKKS
ncbi:spore cortex biosynthesis protein YabQ [Clostridium sp. CAG:798]|jgi:spore cortex biosynthesis protein YabQ|nr:spore cortex biosynthesis protein YabQ [Clostridium sp. CAG:798]